jgi:hypothetical protein
MHEDILAAVIRLNKAKAFLAVEPLHCSLRHESLLSKSEFRWPRRRAAWLLIEVLEEGRQADAVRGEGKSFGRNSIPDP